MHLSDAGKHVGPGEPSATIGSGRASPRQGDSSMVFSPISPSELIQQDREHLIHPLYHPDDHESPIIFAQGKGAVLTDVEGHEYIDGLSCLWNVAVGHGRKELAEAG